MNDIDDLKAIHKPRPEVHQFCVQCWEIWPCPIARVVDELEAARAALEEIAARLEAHQHAMCSECEGIRGFVASVLDAEAWE